MSTGSLPYILKRKSSSASDIQRIRLENLKCATFPTKKIQEWCNVVVLQIHECSNLKVLHLYGLSCLHHLELVGLPELESFYFVELRVDNGEGPNETLESLQHVKLRGLTSFKRLPDFNLCTLLKTFQMLNCEEFLLEPPQFMGCSQLEVLNMECNWQWRVEEIKLDTLTSLTSLHICNNKLVRTWPKEDKLFPLKLTGLGNCSQLQTLKLSTLPITNLMGLEKLTKLQELIVSFCEALQYIPDVSRLTELILLSMFRVPFQQFLGIEKLLQLKRLEFRGCSSLKSLPDLDHLSNLTYAEIKGCSSLRVKPQLPQNCSQGFSGVLIPYFHQKWI